MRQALAHDWPRPADASMHWWFKPNQAEPIRCRKCGTFYASSKTTLTCPAGREAA